MESQRVFDKQAAGPHNLSDKVICKTWTMTLVEYVPTFPLRWKFCRSRTTKSFMDDMTEMNRDLDLVRSSTQILMNICNWLKAPDATVNHNAAPAKRYPSTPIL